MTTRILSQTALSTTASVTMDGKVRQLPGVELFRRSSSLVANPTSQGISLRGLGSTSASRTLVTEDDVPLNDAVGGWIHWEEQPELAIDRVELVRGGASDLYGSSAIGGVVNMSPCAPTSAREVALQLRRRRHLRQQRARRNQAWPVGSARRRRRSSAPTATFRKPLSQRGPVDIASNVHSQNGLVRSSNTISGPLRLFVRGSGINEARANGTPYQINGTRLWRYATGADWQSARNAAAVLRLYGSTEHYRQTFSSISNTPNACQSNLHLSLRRNADPFFALIPDNELGAAAHWSQPFGASSSSSPEPTRTTSASGIASRPSAPPPRSPISRPSARLGRLRRGHVDAQRVDRHRLGRMDWFQNYDGHQLIWNGSTWRLQRTQPPSKR